MFQHYPESLKHIKFMAFPNKLYTILHRYNLCLLIIGWCKIKACLLYHVICGAKFQHFMKALINAVVLIQNLNSKSKGRKKTKHCCNNGFPYRVDINDSRKLIMFLWKIFFFSLIDSFVISSMSFLSVNLSAFSIRLSVTICHTQPTLAV